MILLKNILQEIQSLYSRGVQSDDTRLVFRHIYARMNDIRSRLIEERLMNGLQLHDDYFLVLDFQVIEETNISDNELYPLKDCNLYKTVCQIPSPYYWNSEPLFKYISTVDGSIRFSKTDFITKKYTKFAKFTAKFPRYFYKDDYVYVFNTKEIKWIRIKFLPSDPIEVYTNACINNDCIVFDDVYYPVPDSDVDKLIELTVKTLVNPMLSIPEDRQPDSQDIRQQDYQK